MEEKGYGSTVYERPDGNCAQAVLYNSKKLVLLRSDKFLFEKKASHFFIVCVFAAANDGKTDYKKRFIWIQTHLKAMPYNSNARAEQVKTVLNYLNSNSLGS